MMDSCRTLTVLLALGAVPSLAQEDASPSPSAAAEKKDPEHDKWVPLFARHAGEYRIRVGSTPDSESDAKRLPAPVLRWWQPVRGGDDGALYLWVRGGRPVAAITFFTFKWPDGKRAIVHERHSFAPEPVEARWRDHDVWHTAQPGVTYQPVPGAPHPAASASARLRQMQSITRDFAAHTVDDKDKDWPLRLLPKPLYRYEGALPDSLDGALFALAQGTDPEAFLLVEARGSGEVVRWEFGVARFTDRRVVVKYRGREAYSGRNTTGGSGEVYYSNTVIQKPSDAPEDFD